MGHEHDSFSRFLLPTCAFPQKVSSKNGFSIEGRSLMLNGKRDASISQEKGFQDLFDYIRSKGRCIMISHYSKRFLAQFLVFGVKMYFEHNC